ncbi:ATP-dependent Clp protease proteolytic subunit [Chitinophaga sp. Hz27]|uniref:Clp protease ClpP n=1 Tax=Chitinophaga sp. Hz27 TaxID=3347169 RepID=UPI0035E040D7
MYTVNIESDEPIMLLNRHIGYDADLGYGIMGDQFQAELLQLDSMGKKRIQVWINSPGGSVFEGYSIYNAILKSKTKVDTYCVGVAMSMAAVIFQAGRTRYMADYGILMYHNPFDSNDPEAKNEVLEQMRRSMVKMICERSAMNEDACEKMLNRETFMDASEAYDLKLCDAVEQSSDYNRKRLATVTNDQKAMWKEANAVINQQISKPQLQPILNRNIKSTNMSMLKTTLALGLVEGVPEDAIVNAIKGIQDKAYNAEATVVSLNKKVTDIENASKKTVEEKEAKIADLEDKLTKGAEDLKKLKDELTILKKEKEDAEDSAKSAAAAAMVQSFVACGRIKNDESIVAKWTDRAISDMDGTKELLETLPLNKTAVTLQVENTLAAGELKTTAAGYAAKLKTRLKQEGRRL